MRRARTAVLLAVAVLAPACAGGGVGPTDTAAAVQDATGVPAEVRTGVGVDDKPCPGTPNLGNGCIRLGALADLTGRDGVQGAPSLAGVRAFWDRVNAEGGVAGRWDVLVADAHVRDVGTADADAVGEAIAALEPDVLAVAATAGTRATRAARQPLADAGMLGVTTSTWSGWSGEDPLLTTGASRCVDAANGLDWLLDAIGQDVGDVADPDGTAPDETLGDTDGAAGAADTTDGGLRLPTAVQSVLVVQTTGADADDSVAGAQAAAERAGIDVATIVLDPVTDAASMDGVVEQVVALAPDLVLTATGPTELGLLVAGVEAAGHEAFYLGPRAGFHAALLDSPAGAALAERYLWVGPHAGMDGSSPAGEAMRAAFAGAAPTHDVAASAWVAQYPLLAAMEQAARDGALDRDGLVAASGTATVETEGALASAPGPGDAAGRRASTVGRVDPAAFTGTTTLAEGHVGAAARGMDVDEPCGSRP